MGIGDKDVTIRIFIESNAAVQLKKIGSQVEQFAGKAERSTKRSSRAFLRLGSTLRITSGLVSRLTGRWTAMLGTIGGTFVIFKATSDAQKFGLAIAEIGTIFSGTEKELAGAREAILGLSEDLGFVETIAAKGFYQIISANITDAADAMVILRESSELAAVGLADIKDTIDVVVTAVKAYSLDVSEANRVTDILFQTVIKGRTTIPELATSLGQVLPIAATLGIRLEEVTAAIASLTQGGIDTNVAVIQIRQAMNQLLKLTPQATATLREYGLEITAASIKNDGFAGTLFKIRDAVGENPTAFARIFGNIRALIPALALTGERADEFREILDDIGNSAGVVGKSLDRLLADPFKRFQLFMNALRLRLREVGEAFIEEFNKVLENQGGVTAVIDRLASALEGFKPVAASVAKVFGDFVNRIDLFVKRQGGIERASALFRDMGKFVAAAGRALANVFINGLDLAINLLSQLPRILTATLNDFKRFVNGLAELWNNSLIAGFGDISELFGVGPIEIPFKDVENVSAALLTKEINRLRRQQERIEEATEQLATQRVLAASEAATEPLRKAEREIAKLEEEIAKIERRSAAGGRGVSFVLGKDLAKANQDLEEKRRLLQGIEVDTAAAAKALDDLQDSFLGGEAQTLIKQTGLNPLTLTVGEIREALRKLKSELPQEISDLQEKLNAALDANPFSESLADVFTDETFLKVFTDARAALLPVLKDVKTQADELENTLEGISSGALKLQKSLGDIGGPAGFAIGAVDEAFAQLGFRLDKLPGKARDAFKTASKELNRQFDELVFTSAIPVLLDLDVDLDSISDFEGSVGDKIKELRRRIEDVTGLVLEAKIDGASLAKTEADFVNLQELIRDLNAEAGHGAAAELEFLKKVAKVRKAAFERSLVDEFAVDPNSEVFTRLVTLLDEIDKRARFAAIGVENFGDLMRQAAGDAAPIEAQIAAITAGVDKQREAFRAAGPQIVGGISIISIALQLLEKSQRSQINELLGFTASLHGFTSGLQGFMDGLDLDLPFEEQADAIRRSNDEARESLRLYGLVNKVDVSLEIELVDDDARRQIAELKAEFEEAFENDPAFEFMSAVDRARKALLDGANKLARKQSEVNAVTRKGTEEYERLQAAAKKAQRDALASTAAFGEGFSAQLADLRREMDDLFSRGAELAAGLVDTVRGSFDVGLSAAFKGESDAFDQFRNAFGNALADTTARAVSDGLTQVVFDGLAGIFSGVFGAAEEQASEVSFGISVASFDAAVIAFQVAVATMTGSSAGGAVGEAIGGPAGVAQAIDSGTEAATTGATAAIDSAALLAAFTPVTALLTKGAGNIFFSSLAFKAASGGMTAAVTVMAEAAISIAASAVEIAIAAKAAAVPVATGGFLDPQPTSSVQSFAAGGVPERRRIQRITGGNIVRQKSLFEVGEAGQDELVVPLPGNRKVPVEMRGGGSPRSSSSPTINVTSNVALNIVTDDRSFTDRITQAMPVIERNLTATLQQGINQALETSIQGAASGA